jgi:peptidoglycan/xylan/chitin deacetylase (PgdA/CDA1 family)
MFLSSLDNHNSGVIRCPYQLAPSIALHYMLSMALHRTLNPVIKQTLATLSAGRQGRGLRIFMYHSIDDMGSALSVSPKDFRSHLSLFRQGGWRVLSLTEAMSRLTGVPPREREVWLTFDDGYENFYTHAAPLLGEFGFPATVFLVTDLVGKKPSWFERDRTQIARLLDSFSLALTERNYLANIMRDFACTPLMNWSHIRELQRYGVDFQSHSASHHFLTTLPVDELRADLWRSRQTLADQLGVTAPVLCYPYGDRNTTVTHVTEEAGFSTAVLADDTGMANTRYAINRIGLSSLRPPSHVRFVLSAAFDHYAAWRRVVYHFVKNHRSERV